MQFGWIFWCKGKGWKVTEVENGEEILLIKDYATAEEDKPEPKELTMGEFSELLGYEVKIKK